MLLADAKFETRAVMYGRRYGDDNCVSGPRGLLAQCIPFKTGGALYAKRYNVRPSDKSGNTGAPMASGGKLPPEFIVPATAIYVVFSYQTPIAWVDHDGTVTIPDVKYSRTTSKHQNLCRAWLATEIGK